MPRSLPRSVVIILGILSAVSFTVSMYLETWQYPFLERHPITVNLLSGVVGFSTGLLVIGLVINWLGQRERFVANHYEFWEILSRTLNNSLTVCGLIPGRVYSQIFADRATVMEYFDERITDPAKRWIPRHRYDKWAQRARKSLFAVENPTFEVLVEHDTASEHLIPVISRLLHFYKSTRLRQTDPLTAEESRLITDTCTAWLNEDVAMCIQRFELTDNDSVAMSVLGLRRKLAGADLIDWDLLIAILVKVESINSAVARHRRVQAFLRLNRDRI